jgi:hypothetical protein
MEERLAVLEKEDRIEQLLAELKVKRGHRSAITLVQNSIALLRRATRIGVRTLALFVSLQ